MDSRPTITDEKFENFSKKEQAQTAKETFLDSLKFVLFENSTLSDNISETLKQGSTNDDTNINTIKAFSEAAAKAFGDAVTAAEEKDGNLSGEDKKTVNDVLTSFASLQKALDNESKHEYAEPTTTAGPTPATPPISSTEEEAKKKAKEAANKAEDAKKAEEEAKKKEEAEKKAKEAANKAEDAKKAEEEAKKKEEAEKKAKEAANKAGDAKKAEEAARAKKVQALQGLIAKRIVPPLVQEYGVKEKDLETYMFGISGNVAIGILKRPNWYSPFRAKFTFSHEAGNDTDKSIRVKVAFPLDFGDTKRDAATIKNAVFALWLKDPTQTTLSIDKLPPSVTNDFDSFKRAVKLFVKAALTITNENDPTATAGAGYHEKDKTGFKNVEINQAIIDEVLDKNPGKKIEIDRFVEEIHGKKPSANLTFGDDNNFGLSSKTSDASKKLDPAAPNAPSKPSTAGDSAGKTETPANITDGVKKIIQVAALETEPDNNIPGSPGPRAA